MIDLLQHTLGICGDSHSHFDLLDLLSFSSAESTYLNTLRLYVKYIKIKITNFFI